jgi:hypothetical protein
MVISGLCTHTRARETPMLGGGERPGLGPRAQSAIPELRKGLAYWRTGEPERRLRFARCVRNFSCGISWIGIVPDALAAVEEYLPCQDNMFSGASICGTPLGSNTTRFFPGGACISGGVRSAVGPPSTVPFPLALRSPRPDPPPARFRVRRPWHRRLSSRRLHRPARPLPKGRRRPQPFRTRPWSMASQKPKRQPPAEERHVLGRVRLPAERPSSKRSTTARGQKESATTLRSFASPACAATSSCSCSPRASPTTKPTEPAD